MGFNMQAAQPSPYIAKVLEYSPAPGQFVHDIPEIGLEATPAQALEAAAAQLVGSPGYGDESGMVSLGGFGGYVVFAFDHSVENITGEYDFKVFGNAFGGTGNSSEPGIVCVSVDANRNGIADDEWYELAGSAFGASDTRRNLIITYTRPANDGDNIPWRCSDGTAGEIEFLADQHPYAISYWPQWVDEKEITFAGTCVANNAKDESGKGEYWDFTPLAWGYVDNLPDMVWELDPATEQYVMLPNPDNPGFKIDWAVDSEGKPVELARIDFVKVYTGINQQCGWLGETSTEVTGAQDLHVSTVGIENIDADFTSENGPVVWFDMQGRRVERLLPGHVYVKLTGSKATKVVAGAE